VTSPCPHAHGGDLDGQVVTLSFCCACRDKLAQARTPSHAAVRFEAIVESNCGHMAVPELSALRDCLGPNHGALRADLFHLDSDLGGGRRRPPPALIHELVTGGPLVVIDGDTTDRGAVRYRLIGIEAPEIRQAKCPKEHALGLAAARSLRELVADYEDRIGDLWSLQRAMAEGREDQVAVMAFDLLSLDGFDLRRLHLADRKLWLDELVGCAELTCLSYVHCQVDGAGLFALMEELRLEGVVAKRAQAPYRSGRRKEWVKVKCQSWLKANRHRWRAFVRI